MLEDAWVSPLTLPAVLHSSLRALPPHLRDNAIIRHTVIAWGEVRKLMGLPSTISCHLAIQSNPMFLLFTIYKTFNYWRTHTSSIYLLCIMAVLQRSKLSGHKNTLCHHRTTFIISNYLATYEPATALRLILYKNLLLMWYSNVMITPASTPNSFYIKQTNTILPCSENGLSSSMTQTSQKNILKATTLPTLVISETWRET